MPRIGDRLQLGPRVAPSPSCAVHRAVPILAVFAATLFGAVLISELARRSIVSTSVWFLLVGFLGGPELANVIHLTPQSPALGSLAEWALFAVLFTDGMEISKSDLLRAWKPPGRALLIGLPLTVVGTAALARWLVGLEWPAALLLGAVLSPTDPVFASAIVGEKHIPRPLRDLLNIESGLNDGLALPLVLGLIGYLGARRASVAILGAELAGGIGLGIALPFAACWLERLPVFGVTPRYAPLFGVSVGLGIFALSHATGANEYLAAFTGAVTLASTRPEFRDEFRRFGELVSELLKLATLLVFGALLSPRFFASIPASGYVFAALALIVVRPAALTIALVGERLGWRERIAAYWFGPKGFASVVYGLIVMRSGIADADMLVRLIGLVVAGSIIAHSSTDVIVARWFAPSSGSKQPRA